MPQRKRGRKPAAKQTRVTASRDLSGKDVKKLIPPVPAGLDSHGAVYWTAIGQQLLDCGVLSPMHFETFRIMCERYQEYRRLHDWLMEDPSRCSTCGESGYEAPSPQLLMRNKAFDDLLKMWSKFGLTPHSLLQICKKSLVETKVSKLDMIRASKYAEDESKDNPPP